MHLRLQRLPQTQATWQQARKQQNKQLLDQSRTEHAQTNIYSSKQGNRTKHKIKKQTAPHPK